MEKPPQMSENPNEKLLNELEREADLTLEKYKMEHSNPDGAEFKADNIIENRKFLYEEVAPRLEKAREDLERARDNRMRLEGIRVKTSEARAVTPEWKAKHDEVLDNVTEELGDQVHRVEGYKREIETEEARARNILDRNPHVKHVLQEEARKEDEERSKS